MDINCFSYCLKDLISNNDKVAVPGLGLFFTSMVSATFSDNRAVINPPYWEIRFKKTNVPLSDGKDFISQISKQMTCSMDQAETELKWCIDRLKNELEQTKTCTIPGLGIMRADSQNDFYFLPDDGVDVSFEGLGFEPVHIKFSEPDVKKKNIKWWLIVLIVIVLAIAGVVCFAYFFSDVNSYAKELYLWIDNILNHILYSSEELELLGL